jgi:hypothetical protein
MGKGECTALRENEGEEGENDLKRGHVRVLNRVCSIATRCVRSYSSRIVHSVWCAHTHSECVCNVGLCARTHVSEFERKPASAIERTVVHLIAWYRK